LIERCNADFTFGFVQAALKSIPGCTPANYATLWRYAVQNEANTQEATL
jgi:hypothetical protein